MRFLAALLGRWVYRLSSPVVALVLRCRGVRVGRGFYIEGFPYLKLNGCRGAVMIGDGVRVHGAIDLRTRENGQIQIDDGVTLDRDCRLVAAAEAVLHLQTGADVGCFTIFNCGADVTVGKGVLISGFCYIQSSGHGIARSIPIREQPHHRAAIVIGEEAWLAAHVAVLPGVTIGMGAVVGAHSVVTHSLESFSINVGIPARQIAERTD